jgi:Sjoegren syndrome nuclear autoantigen 1
MAAHGASLQNFNNQLVTHFEELKEKREAINTEIIKEEEAKAQLQKEIALLTERLHQVNESLNKKVAVR